MAAWRITNGLRLDITRHVLGLDHEFHRKHTPGELIQRVDGDVTNVSNFLSQVVPKVAGAAIVLSGMLGVLDRRSTGGSALGMLVYLGLSILLVLSMRHKAVRESSDEMGSYARLYGGIEERLTAVEDLRANGAENHAMWRFVEDSAEAIETAVRREAAFLRMWWALQIDVAIGLVGTLVLSARAGQQRGDHARHGVPPVPVRAPDDQAAGGARRPARGDPEGQRGDEPRRRVAGHRADGRRPAARRRHRRAR